MIESCGGLNSHAILSPSSPRDPSSLLEVVGAGVEGVVVDGDRVLESSKSGRAIASSGKRQ